MTEHWQPNIDKGERKFPFAYFWNEDREEFEAVRLRYEAASDGTVAYDPDIHRELKCPCAGCKAKLKYISLDPLMKDREAFRTAPGARHADDCTYKPFARRPRVYDDSLGLLVKVQQGSAGISSIEKSFNEMAGQYRQDHLKHPRLRDEFDHLSLKTRRPASIHASADYQSLVRQYGPERMEDSLFDTGLTYLNEKDFVIRYPRRSETQDRFKDLFQALRGIPAGNHLPRLIEFRVKGTAEKENQSGSVVSQQKFLFREMGECGHGGVVHFMVPRAKPASSTSQNLRESLVEEGRYLILGQVRLADEFRRGNNFFHYIDVTIDDPVRQIARIPKDVSVPDVPERDRRQASFRLVPKPRKFQSFPIDLSALTGQIKPE